MAQKPDIRITLVERKGSRGCHRGHRVGDVFYYNRDRGRLCPMALHSGFPYIDILRYGGTLPPGADGTVKFCCPDADTINVFKLEVVPTAEDA